VNRTKFIWIVVVGLIVLTAGSGVTVYYRNRTSRKVTVVRLEPVSRGELVEIVSAPGEIEPRTKVEISAKTSARIVELPYEEGHRVTCGNPNADPPIPASILVRLDSKDLESQLLNAEANYAAQAAEIEVKKAHIASQRATLAGLEASLEQAKRDLERQKELFASNDISQATFDQTKLRVEELKSQYEAAKHTLQAAELNLAVLRHNLEAAAARVAQARQSLSYTTITSPIDGVVTRINAEVGELVVTGTMNNPGTVIMEVADLSQMLVVAQVAEADVGKLQPGQKATVYIDAYPDRQFKGTVQAIALAHTMSYTRTKYFRTEILLEHSDVKLHEGLTAHVDIETRRHTNVIKVPSQAVLARPVDELPLEVRDGSPLVDKTKTYATVVYRYVDGKAIATPVKIGQSDLTHTIIEEGLEEGQRIVVGPYKVLEKLSHGQRIIDEREQQAAKSKTKHSRTNQPTADTNHPQP